MFRRDTYTLLVQLLNPKLKYVGNCNSLLALAALQDNYALAICNIKLCRERDADKFLTYSVPELIYH